MLPGLSGGSELIAGSDVVTNISKRIMPPARIGIIGGGQLGRMLAFEAKRMGYAVTVLDPTLDCPAAQVADAQITASFYDCEEIRRLAQLSDVVTYEFEHVDADILCRLADEGFNIRPSGHTLKRIQNKFIQKSVFKGAGLPVPRFAPASSVEELQDAVKLLGLPLMLKSCTGGYDGKGNALIEKPEHIKPAWDALLGDNNSLMAEEFIKFERELSIIVARGQDNSTVFFPVAENTHSDSILRITRAAADIPSSIRCKLEAIAQEVMDVFDDVGVFCIEVFLTSEKEIYINEVAPRTHNSGHYTIEACVTSQFEQHLRAIAGLPLGSTRLLSPAVMVNILGRQPMHDGYAIQGLEQVLEEEEVYFHFYGKHFIDINKKIGHITALGDSLQKAEEKALGALAKLIILPL